MTDGKQGIALATPDDVGGILDLQECNLSENGGSLSVPFSRDWFEAAADDGQVIVARNNGRVAGYLVFCSFEAQAHVPIVQAMLKAGRNPTRADLVTAIQKGMPQGPAVAPYSYSSSDHMGITGAYMGVIQNGQLVQQGPVLTTDASASGAISTYSGSEQQAPASGIPSP